MTKKKLFEDDSEEEVALKTENEYAKKYDAWREKEEIHKLEQKYGSKALDPEASSDSEDESDSPPEVSEEMETQFLKTLALLKTKDPRIYDPNYKFFNETEEKPEEKKLENEDKPKTLTFTDSDDDDDDDNDDPNIFTIEKKAEIDKSEPDKKSKKQIEKTSKEGKLKDFLTGKVEHVEDEVEKDLEPLKAFWSDPKLNEGEAFLRDYILNKRYMDEDDGAEDKLRDDVELEADEAMVEEQGQFERAYNFRFEEPDDEYLKRYPRTMNSIRPKDERRARRRAETRERKEAEKKKKMEEVARLKALKLKEVREKIARLKEVTGNQQLAFQDEDIEGDFDPEEHDKRMRAIFDESYYGEADDQKPVFPDLDEELEIENWEKYEQDEFKEQNADDDDAEPHCEDEDFNMDADYDPKKARENLLEELKQGLGKKRRNRKRKTKLGQLLATAPPTFVPQEDQNYAQFMEEYYKMDCEDIIGGDLPTRFKYRQVVPNDYGLSIEEILLADDKELTQWVPLKKIVKHRPANVEKSEVNTYRQKAADVSLKKKMLPSLFKDLPEDPEVVVPIDNGKKKKRKKKKKVKETTECNASMEETQQTADNGFGEITCVEETPTKNKKNKKRKASVDGFGEKEDVEVEISTKHNNKGLDNSQNVIDCNDENKKTVNDLESSGKSHDDIKVKPFDKRKKKHSGTFIVETVGNVEPSQATYVMPTVKKEEMTENKAAKQSNKRLNSESSTNDIGNSEAPRKKKKLKNAIPSQNKHHYAENNNKNVSDNTNVKKKTNNKKDFKKKFKSKEQINKPTHPFSNLSDERLKAYGLNPKKYKNFLKYKKF